MTERYGSGSGDEGHRPSGRGAVTERLARQSDEVREIDLTDEATARAAADDTDGADGAPAGRDGDQADRESSGAFEPASPVVPAADPPAEATRPESSSIFDVDERDKQEEEHPTGYEPPVADTDSDRSEEASDDSGEITPTPVPAASVPAGTPVPEGLSEPPSATGTDTAADTDSATDTDVAAATDSAGTPAAEATAGSPLASLDAAAIRNRFIDIQAGFVDEPRQAVEEAGRFVDDLVQQVAEALRQQRGQLAGPEGSTEDLRLALRSYRQFVDRLLELAS
jgi:hypothetical protein